ncbi:MAG: efflux RND transporter permease subunit, partial [Deltaproteobacteria bacterium]
DHHLPGLAPYGGKTRQVMIDVDPAALAAHDLSNNDLMNALLGANLIIPAGSIRIGASEFDVSVNNSPSSIDEFARIPVKVVNGATVYLGDVARAHDGFATQSNIVRVDGKRSTYLAILKKADASTLAVVDATKALLPAIRAAAPAGIEVSLDSDQSVFVRAAISGVLREALISAALVSVMILFFLGSWRSVVIVCTSIPLAILVALIGLYAQSQTLNIMTLGGLALAIGMLVDDATVEVENIHRNRHLGKPLTRAILDGAHEIAVPALAATLTICIVFSPVVLLSGPAKFLFTPLAFSVVWSMLASYGLSRTLVPVLARMLMASETLDHGGATAAQAQSRWQRFNRRRDQTFERVVQAYAHLLSEALQHRKVVLGAAVAMLVALVPVAMSIGTDFFPEVDAGQMRLHVRAPLGTRIEDSEHLVADVERCIRSIVPAHEIASITDNLGLPTSYNLGFVQSDSTGGQDADILVALTGEHHSTAAYRRALRAALPQQFPGVHFYFQAADIVSQVLNFGLPAVLEVAVEGQNLEASMEVARSVRDRLQAIPGIVDVRIPQGVSHPAFEVEVDRVRAAQLGVSQHDVASNMLTSLSSSALVSPSYWLSPKNSVNYLVALQTPLDKARSVDDLLGLPVTPSSTPAIDRASPFAPARADAPYLGSLAALRSRNSKPLISHSAVQRVVQVHAGVEDRDLGSVAAEVRQLIATQRLPKGTQLSLHGQSESMNSSFTSLGIGLILAILLVYLLMVTLFQSWLDPLIIMVAVPGALCGVLVMLALTRTTLNVESLMGTVMAVGVAVSNSILMVNFANECRQSHDPGALAAALEAGKTRLRPVLMTALAMILGMLPMALGLGEGGEQNAPLGRAVIGGLLVATCVTLFIVPVVYSLLRLQAPNKAQLDAAFEASLREGQVEKSA